MTVFEAIVIAVVEGITEFLPISSTGHMIITESLLGMNIRRVHQSLHSEHPVWGHPFGSGFVLATLLQSWSSTKSYLLPFFRQQSSDFLAGDLIDSLLENVLVVAITMFLGGILLLLC